ncbi:hypothetical protein ACHQM5_002735 [Ranunculus cassubicifolius]
MLLGLKRIVKPGSHPWRTITSATSHNSAIRHHQNPRTGIVESNVCSNVSKCSGPGYPWASSLTPAILTGFLGMGLLTYADANQDDIQAPTVPETSPPLLEPSPSIPKSSSPLPESPPSLLPDSPSPALPKSSSPLPESSPLGPESPPSGYVDVEKTVKKERIRLEELLKSKGMAQGSYPKFTVAMKGQKVSIKFHVPPTCGVAQLIVELASHLGLKAEQRGGSDVILRAWNSAVAWQMTLLHPETKGDLGGGIHAEKKDGQEGDLCILIFQSLISSDSAEIEFIKQGSFSKKELDALVSALKLAGEKMLPKRPLERRRESRPDSQKSLASLEAMGVKIFGLNETHKVSSPKEISWDNIAGYEQQKREVEDTILLALHSPKIYDDIAKGTRRKYESNRPRAVLFEGPPVISIWYVFAQGVPLLYVPLEAVMSKYYGESERLFGAVFTLANSLPDGAIVFLDEIDSFAAARDDGMHEATRRILSVLLRQIDGFEQDKRVVVIAATNRKEDLDPALINRFDSMVTFGLPDEQTRQEIAAQYAKHLNKSQLAEFAAATEEMSGRDIRDVCQQAERHWASKIIRGQVANEGGEQGCVLPPLQEYVDSALYRRNALVSLQEKKNKNSEDVPRKKKSSPMQFL